MNNKKNEKKTVNIIYIYNMLLQINVKFYNNKIISTWKYNN